MDHITGSVNIVTLGCSKNLVDSEYLLKQLQTDGFSVYHDAPQDEYDVVILNTCGFILDAKQESIDTVLSYTDQKKKGIVKMVIVMGCLSERYREELLAELPEVDGFFGVWDHREILNMVGSTLKHKYVNRRLTTTPSHYSYLKISEGCDRSCSFCAIPGIRGKQRSKPVADLVDEAVSLVKTGVKEILLIAQDLTNYGRDLNGMNNLPALLRSLSAIEDLEWIRLHYAYPTGFPSEVIALMNKDPKICRYLDIPLQHVNDRILHSMNRGHSRAKLESLLNELREGVPGVAIRTTMLVGYPGETEEEFEELYEFVKNFRFDRLGVFPYSHEEDTPAYSLRDDIPKKVKQERMDRLMLLQQQISHEINLDRIGLEMNVLTDREEGEYIIARTEFDSPEVDNEVLIKKFPGFQTGEFYKVRITNADEFDLYAELTV